MYARNLRCITTVAREPDGIQTRCNHRQTKLAIAMNSALICFGVATVTLSGVAVAQSNMIASSAEQTYNISAGSLKTALDNFAKQKRISLFFKDTEVEGKTTKGLNGNYTLLDGLNQLLSGSNLQAILQGDVYVVQNARASESSDSVNMSLPVKPKSGTDVKESVATLPEVVVSAKESAAPSATSYTIKSTSTAMKTNTPLLDTPQSISVVTQAMIKDQAIQSMADVVRYVPGVGISQGEGNRDAIVFRGNRSTADFFVSGIRDDVQYFRDIYNIESVEVLKGPNGMIFGRGGSGGVINRVIKEAGWNQKRELTVQAGSFDTKRVALDVGQGVNDVAAVRLNAMYEDSGSFRNGVDLKRYGINPTVTLMPSDNTKVVLNAEYFKDQRTADRGVPSLNGRPLNTNASTFFGDPDRSNADTELKAVNGLIEHKFNDEVMIRNRTRYSSQDKFYGNIYPNAGVKAAESTVSLGAYNNTTQRDSFFNQTDLLFSLNTGKVKHDLVVGVEIGHQDTDSTRNTGYFNGSATSVNVPINNPITAVPVTYKLSATDNDINSVTKQTALYVQDQIKLMPKLQAILGVRYDRIEVDLINKNPAIPSALNVTNNLFSPRAGLVFKPIDIVSIYTSYSLSYVPRAGEQLTSLTITNAALEPEKFKNIEIGAKWDIRPNLALTTAVFKLDRTNVIITDPNNSAISYLGGGQRNKGFELGLAGQMTEAWSVMGGYTYQDGVITNTQSATAKNGAVLAELPKNVFSLWNRYNINPTWGVGLGVINRGAMYTSTDNTVRLPGFTRVDAAVYAKINKNMRAQLNIENLFDRNYYASANGNNNILPGSPLAARVSLVAKF